MGACTCLDEEIERDFDVADDNDDTKNAAPAPATAVAVPTPPTLEVRSNGQRIGDPFEAGIEEVLPDLRRMAWETGKKLTLHRASDGRKLAVAAPWRIATGRADTADASDPVYVGNARVQR